MNVTIIPDLSMPLIICPRCRKRFRSDDDARAHNCISSEDQAYAAGFRAGAEAFRDAAVKEIAGRIAWTMHGHIAKETVAACADAIRAIPLPTENPQQLSPPVVLP